MNRVVILGASRGLGAALVKEIGQARPVTGFARKEAKLQELAIGQPRFEFRIADFAKQADQESVLNYLIACAPEKVFYLAGGGPYGRFFERGWKDHLWAMEVSFLFAARVAHTLQGMTRPPQYIVTGSAVAETNPDAKAASYSAAKHALKGLVFSLRQESPDWDVRLFSPGYMDTEMLPANAAVRNAGVYSPAAMAADLWAWSQIADESGHRLYPVHPD